MNAILRCTKCDHRVAEWVLCERKFNDGMCPMCGGALLTENPKREKAVTDDDRR